MGLRIHTENVRSGSRQPRNVTAENRKVLLLDVLILRKGVGLLEGRGVVTPGVYILVTEETAS